MSWFKRRDKLIAMQQFRDGKGNIKLFCMTKRKVLEYDPERKVWRNVSMGIAKEITK